MRAKLISQSGIFNLRTAFALVLIVFSGSLGYFTFAATPSSGTLSTANPVVTYTAGPFAQANPSPLGLGQLDTGPRCDSSAFPCDTFHLTVTLPNGYTAANPNATIKVTMSWTDLGAGQSDYDLYIFKLPRSDCYDSLGNPSADCTNTDGFESADSQSASGSNPEVANVAPRDGTTTYTFHIVPYTPTGETVNVQIELLAGAPGSGGGGSNGTFGAADPTVPGNARYMNFYAPRGSTAEPSQGEFNIGYNPATHRIMVMNNGPVWRLSLPEYLTQAKPECCEALWEDVSPVTTETGVDPILWTDQHGTTSRTFASNFTAGANALYAWSDDDGTNWTQVGLGAGNGGADHETIATGPYPNIIPFNIGGASALNNPANPVTRGHASYYCSQDIVGPAACYRSDTLGVSWGPLITLPYTGSGAQGCGGLHGHIHVAPDGTVWLPVNQCNSHQGGAFSTDGGQSWTEFIVPNNVGPAGNPPTGISQANGADPSIAIDANSRIYYAYVNNQANGIEGRARVATGTLQCTGTNPVTGARTGCSVQWDRDIDIGDSHGIVNAAEIEAIGGDAGRAAVGFIGTNRSGDYQAGSFPGSWYAFIAMTYNSGQNWTTVNATPNDPVQSKTGIWQQGGGGQNGDRNLLDFNEITVGDRGQVLYGYSDGCTSTECVQGSSPSNLGAAMRVARQTGGKTLYAAFDPAEPIIPKAPCLSGTRTALESFLSWKVPDNGGADIQSYKIYRSNSSGGESFLAQTVDATPSYHDLNPPSDQHLYYKVTAINASGESVLSNEIDLVLQVPALPQSACVLPGLTELTDGPGDTSAVLGLINTPAPPGSDLLALSVAQPYRVDNSEPRLVFTINTDPNAVGFEPAGWSAYAAFQMVNNGTTTYKGVRMYFNGATPVFEYYTPSPNNSGGVDGRFVASGSNHPAESGSYNAAAGIITITVKISDLGLAVGDTIKGFVAGTGQSSDAANIGAGITSLYDQMPNSLSFTGTFRVGFNSICGATSPGVVSRKIHGSAGPFDLPLSNSPGSAPVEPRSGGSENAYTVVYTFANNLGFAGAGSIAQGSGNVASTEVGPNLNQVTVTLTGVNTAQRLALTLHGAQDAAHAAVSDQTAYMNVLVGDTNGDGEVNSADITHVKSQSGVAVTSSNYRDDVIVDGNINSADISRVKSASGTALPPAAAAEPAKPAKPRTGPNKPRRAPVKSRDANR